MLPYGNLRERKHESRRADIIVVTKTPEKLKPIEKKIFIKDLEALPYQFLYFTTYNYKNPEPVFEECTGRKPDFRQIKQDKASILLVTGIARPQPLVKFLSGYSNNIAEMKFPDHHDYTMQDIKRITASYNRLGGKTRYIFTTEKDACRFREIMRIDKEICSEMYYIPVEVKFLYEGAKKFNRDLIAYIKNIKKINKLNK